MTRFTKYTLLVAVLVLVAAATAGAVTYSYFWRGYFSIGGEWLIPAVAIAVRGLWRGAKRLVAVLKGKGNG